MMIKIYKINKLNNHTINNLYKNRLEIKIGEIQLINLQFNKISLEII